MLYNIDWIHTYGVHSDLKIDETHDIVLIMTFSP